jgi:hypothetical protein
MPRSNSTWTDHVAGRFGARDSGKSHDVKAELAASSPPRLIIIDAMDEYGAHAERVATLVDLVRRSSGPEWRLRYVPPDVGTEAERLARSEMFCKLAWARGRLRMVIEEAQLYTRASSAPPAWAQCTLRGRHRQIAIDAITQRPALIDKNFFSNATWLRTGRLNFEPDVQCMAQALRVDRLTVGALQGREWIARDMRTGELSSTPSIEALTARARGTPSNASSQKVFHPGGGSIGRGSMEGVRDKRRR